MHNKTLPFIAILMLLAVTVSDTSADGLPAKEQAIAQWINEHSEEAIGALEILLDIDSPTENHAGQREAGDFFRTLFDDMGFSTGWMDMR